MTTKTKVLILVGILLAIGGYFLFDSIYGIGAGIMGLIFKNSKPEGLDLLTDKENELNNNLENLEDELNNPVDDLDLDSEADHWNN